MDYNWIDPLGKTSIAMEMTILAIVNGPLSMAMFVAHPRPGILGWSMSGFSSL